MTEKIKNSIQKISVFKITMVTAAFIVSVRNLPMLASTGLSMIFFSLLAVITFLIPTALVSAELATGWPEKGGVYAWVREAFGERFGFLAIWLQWIQMIFGMVAVMGFIAGSLAYIINPALATNKTFIVAVILIVYWGATLLNLGGMKTSSMVSTVCVTVGVFIPGALIIILGIIYLFSGNPIQINLALTAKNIFPNFSNIHNVTIFTTILFIFLGIEASAAHANEVDNPQKNFPKVIFMTGLIMVVINVVGAMAVAFVVPAKDISLVAGLMEAFEKFFGQFHLLWLVPVLAALTSFGAVGQVSTWILGPVKGFLATAENGDLPPIFSKTNKNGTPTTLVIIQATLISIVGLSYAVVPNINTTFIMVLNVTAILYVIMYILMLTAAIKLRYSHPEVPRAYKIPGGNWGIWVISIVGIIISLFAIFVGFIPPSEA